MVEFNTIQDFLLYTIGILAAGGILGTYVTISIVQATNQANNNLRI